MTFHELISVFTLIINGLLLHRAIRLFMGNKEAFDYIISIVSFGLLGNLLMGLLKNYIYFGVTVFGESFSGAILFSSAGAIYLLKDNPNKVTIFNLSVIFLFIGSILGKLGCLLSHPECYGIATTFVWGIDIYQNGIKLHPLPAYYILFQLILCLILGTVWYKKKYSYIGIIWISLSSVFDFALEFLKRLEPLIFYLSFSQIIYAIIIAINIPFIILFLINNPARKGIEY